MKLPEIQLERFLPVWPYPAFYIRNNIWDFGHAPAARLKLDGARVEGIPELIERLDGRGVELFLLA